MPEAREEHLIMANTTDHYIWLWHQMMVDKAVSTKDLRSMGCRMNKPKRTWLKSVQQVTVGGVVNPPTYLGTSAQKSMENTQKMIDKELDEMLWHGNKSSYSSPVVIVMKKHGGMQFCIDYWHLNGQAKIDQYPLPRIDDALDSLSGARYFSMLDLASGYWQLHVTMEEIEKTAFHVRKICSSLYECHMDSATYRSPCSEHWISC